MNCVNLIILKHGVKIIIFHYLILFFAKSALFSINVANCINFSLLYAFQRLGMYRTYGPITYDTHFFHVVPASLLPKSFAKFPRKSFFYQISENTLQSGFRPNCNNLIPFSRIPLSSDNHNSSSWIRTDHGCRYPAQPVPT